MYRLKGLEPKNKDHTNFYEHCDLMKKYIYPILLTYLKVEILTSARKKNNNQTDVSTKQSKTL